MKFSLKTALAVFILLLAIVTTVLLIKLAYPVSDIKFLSKVAGKELQTAGNSLTAYGEYGFLYYCEELKDETAQKEINIYLYTDRDQKEGLQKTEKIVKRFFPHDASEIMAGVMKGIELAKESKFINGYPLFKIDNSENGSSVKIVDWRNETGGANTCISIYMPKGGV